MTERQYGIAGTIIIHSILLVLLIFTYLSVSKPVSSEGGILINFGDSESAFGLNEPAENSESSQIANTPPPQNSDAEEGVLTQNFEEAPAINKPEVKKNETKKPVVKPEKPLKSSVEPKTPEVNKKAIYSNKSTTGKSTNSQSGSSEGIYKGSGNMGNPTGSTESDSYSGGLTGNGIGFNLNGRNPLHLQEPEFEILKEGIVVVEITVDRSGKVIMATPGIKGSTIVDNTLYSAAKKAALNSKFNIKDDAPERQMGTISYHFKLK